MRNSQRLGEIKLFGGGNSRGSGSKKEVKFSGAAQSQRFRENAINIIGQQ
jgi:hypothetical protein